MKLFRKNRKRDKTKKNKEFWEELNTPITIESESYNSFSKVDIRATLNNRTIGIIEGISYSVSRNIAPVYTMGTHHPVEFARGRRSIAGTIHNIVFDDKPPKTPFDITFRTRSHQDGEQAGMFIGGVEMIPPLNIEQRDDTCVIYSATYIAQGILFLRSCSDDNKFRLRDSAVGRIVSLEEDFDKDTKSDV